jgi:hypothetical protein
MQPRIWTLKTHPGQHHTPHWSKHDTARLLHVIASPISSDAVKALCQPATREELDRGLQNPFEHFLKTFKSEDFQATHPAPKDPDLNSFDPNKVIKGHGADKLKKKWNAFRAEFTKAFNNWSASGQNNLDNFKNFIRTTGGGAGDLSLLYGFQVLRDLPALEMVLRVMPTECCGEIAVDSVSVAYSSADSVDTSASSMAKKKRSRSNADESAVDVQFTTQLQALESAAVAAKRQADLASLAHLDRIADPKDPRRKRIQQSIDELETQLYK